MFDNVRWLLVSDVDGTLTVENSIWEYLHRRVGKWESEGLPNLNSYLNGEIDYPEFARLDALAYEGLTRKQLDAYASEIPRRAGMEVMLNRLSRRGGTIVLLSSGLDILLNQIPHADYRLANKLCFSEDTCTGKADVLVPMDGKGDALREIIKQSGVSRERVVVLGDSRGDIPVMKQAGYSIAVNASDEDVLKTASASIDGSSLIRVFSLVEEYMTGVELRKGRASR